MEVIQIYTFDKWHNFAHVLYHCQISGFDMILLIYVKYSDLGKIGENWVKNTWGLFVLYLKILMSQWGFPDSSIGKDSAYNAGDPGLIPGSWRSAGEGQALQYSGLESSMDSLVLACTWLWFGFPCNSVGKSS